MRTYEINIYDEFREEKKTVRFKTLHKLIEYSIYYYKILKF